MASISKRQRSSETYRVMYGTCPDDGCQAKLYFPSYDKSIECTSCGQRHERSALKGVAEVTNSSVAVHNLLKNILLGNVKPKKGAENVKVLGLSNYVCKLISPILTYYGMDRESGKAKKLKEMGKGEIFDVSILGDRAFVIEEEHLNVNGYGKDRSGSLSYLADTLMDIRMVNDNRENLVPIHADGDGHCLVHAISRSLVGRELFWHALRINLKRHLIDNLEKYKQLFQDFVDQDEWEDIIDECDPYYLPPEGEALGMRNIHIFGLANVLRRPIILLDSKHGMNSSGDYSGVFLPGLTRPEDCRGKDGNLNKPLVIAWSSSGRNHYIPLVPVKGLGPARLPKFMVQKAWGMPRETINDYLEFDNKFCCVVYGDKCLTDRYLRQLVSTMEEIFVENYEVSPSLVADVHQYIYKSAGIVGMLPNEVIEKTQQSVSEKKLFRCLMCEALTEYALAMDQFERGGSLYNLAVSIHKKLDPTKLYSFPNEGAVCAYDEKQDCLVLDVQRSQPKTCAFCQGDSLRQVKADGSVLYVDGDKTTTPCVGGKCPCGFKHFWGGKEYDNIPEIFPITLQWGGKMVTERIPWFQYESDPTLNSNVYEVAQALVQKHFPGEFGSERLVQRVVDSILDQSARALKENKEDGDKENVFGDGMDAWSADTASKIILTGQKKKTIHKEELVKSEKEKNVRKQIVSNAPKVQQKKTQELVAKKSPQKVSDPKQQNVKFPVSKSSHTVVSSTSPVPGTSTLTATSHPLSTQSHSTENKIRLQTSDGRQVMLTVVKDVTYSELQLLISEKVDVPPERQKIRHGFPPKVLEPPAEGEEDKPVDIHHGDKLTLEILPDPNLSQMTQSYPPPSSTKQTATWSSFDEGSQNQNSERFIQALKDIQQSGDSIDTSVASLRILSELAGKDFWTYVQGMPHLFSVGGLLYTQVQRDLGLVDGKHCQLPCLPGKVFRYSSAEDRLELCLEPYGHFPVEPNIEQKVKDSGLHREQSTSREEVKFGSSGAIHHGHERKAFSGQGHSLKGADDRMPMDLACASHRPQARGFHDLCQVPGTHQDSIPEEAEETAPERAPEQEEVIYQRLGPGYSVLDPATVNSHNASLEMFRALAETIEKTLSESMDQDVEDSDMEKTDDRDIQKENPSDPQVMLNDLEDSPGIRKVKLDESANDQKFMEIEQKTRIKDAALEKDPAVQGMAVEKNMEVEFTDKDENIIGDCEDTVIKSSGKVHDLGLRDVEEMDTENIEDRIEVKVDESLSVAKNVSIEIIENTVVSESEINNEEKVPAGIVSKKIKSDDDNVKKEVNSESDLSETFRVVNQGIDSKDVHMDESPEKDKMVNHILKESEETCISPLETINIAKKENETVEKEVAIKMELSDQTSEIHIERKSDS